MTLDEARAEMDRITSLPARQFAKAEMRAEACLDRIRILRDEEDYRSDPEGYMKRQSELIQRMKG